jgi:hypothetical protein
MLPTKFRFNWLSSFREETVYIYVGKTICIIYGIINNINTSYHYFIHLHCQYEKEEFCHIYRVWKLFIILFSVT